MDYNGLSLSKVECKMTEGYTGLAINLDSETI